jgi:autotransporter-associated beta strand protein
MKRVTRTVGLGAALVAFTSAAAAHAAIFTWDGGGSTTAWSDDLNWAGNVQPANNGTADIRFGPTNKVMTVVNQNWNINSLVFNNDAPGIQFIDDASTSLTIQASTGFGIGLTNLTDNSHSIENPIILGNSQIWNIATGIMGFEGGISLQSHTLFMTVNGDAVFLIGPISGTQTSALVKSGAGDLRMVADGTNTYTGTTTVNEGTLVLGKSIFGAPAILGPLVIGDGTGGLEADKVLLQGNGQIDGDVLINSSGLLDLNGFNETLLDLSLTGGRVRTGAGALTLPGGVTTSPSLSSSRIIVDSFFGTFNLGTSAGFTTFDVANGLATDDLVIDGEISGAAGRGLQKAGTGRLVFAGGAPNTYPGATIVSGGTLVLNKSNTDAAIQGDLLIGTTGTETATVELGLNFQIEESSTNEVTIGELGTLNMEFSDNIGPLVMRGGSVTGNGTLTVGFGVSSQTSAQTALISSGLSLNGSVQNFDIAGGSANPDLDILGGLFNGGVNKTGIGTLVLRGFNTYTGPTTVNGGTLLVNNTVGSGTGSGSVAVNASSTLGGDGSVSGSVSVASAGVLAPGNSIGDLAVGAVAFGSLARFNVELGGLTAGTQFDQLIVAGNALLNGQLGVSLVGGFVPATGNTFKILTSGGIVSGTFSTLSLPAVAGGKGLTWQVHYNPGDVTMELLSALLGDYNGNGVVDAADYVVWRNTLGQSPPGLAADGNSSGTIDAGDYTVWRTHFGQTAGSGSGASANAAVPEPATLVQLLVGTLALLFRRRATVS